MNVVPRSMGRTPVVPLIARLSALAFLVCSAIPVAASSKTDLPPEVLKQTGEQLGRCAGVYRLFAFVDERQGKSASAELARGKERGAIVAAEWMFAMRHIQL